MKQEWKLWLRCGVTLFILYLASPYWAPFCHLASLAAGAASPLLLGGVIAYAVNILMSFYERHFFPHSNKKFICRSRRAFCLLFAFATSLAIIALVVALIVPQLVSCVKLLIAEVPGAFTSC